jgi:hypothetical protein
LGDHFNFGGGATQSTMNPVVLAAAVLAALALLVLPRKYAILPSLIVVFLTPAGQQLLFDGFHFFVPRIIAVAGLLRLVRMKVSSRTRLFGDGLKTIDKLFFAYAMLHAATFIFLFKDMGAVTYQLGLLLDACVYLVCRCFIRDREDVLRIVKTMALVAVVLGTCMGYEYLSRVNVFSYINSFSIVPWLRDGRVRAQGTFSNSITAGTFGATLFPLFFWLWKGGKAKVFGILGLVAASAIAVTAMASTGIMAFGAGIFALFLWPIRKYMRALRWGVVLTVLALAMVMRAPVWFIIARVDFVGGHGWDRAALIDAAVRHFSDWWLLGTKTNAEWGADTWDACNQFVYEATSGGLATLVIFVAMLSWAFRVVGRARRQVEGSPRQEWFFWCLGAALYAHVMGFWGIDYFDAIRTWWYIFLAMIPAATIAVQRASLKSEKISAAGEFSYAVSGSSAADEPFEERPVGISISRHLFD